MKRYTRKFQEEDSLSSLTDVTLPKKIQEFFLANPFPKDHEQFHTWAEKQGYKEASELEEYLYAFLTLIFCGGKSEGKDVKASKENMDIGHQIEIEHCSYDTDNKVVKAMQEILVHKISCDHLSETETYYVDGVKSFKDELKQEGK